MTTGLSKHCLEMFEENVATILGLFEFTLFQCSTLLRNMYDYVGYMMASIVGNDFRNVDTAFVLIYLGTHIRIRETLDWLWLPSLS